MIQYSVFPLDPRPSRAAAALVDAGMEVDLLCISSTGAEPRKERLHGVSVFRTKTIHRRSSKWKYLWNYGRFFLDSFWFLSSRCVGRRYDVVHIHNMPDVLIFTAFFPKMMGSKIILDLHDPMPELASSINGTDSNNWLVTLLTMIESWSIEFADIALTPNLSFRDRFISRGCPPGKIEIVMNSPDPKFFDQEQPHPSGRSRDKDGFRIMHHGLISHRHGVDRLVEAVSRVRTMVPEVRLDIYGREQPFLETVLATARRLGVQDIVHFHGFLTQAEIARAIRCADLGIVPNRPSRFTELNLPTRIFEYLALHCPVIVPSTQGIKDYFRPDEIVIFEMGNYDDLVAKILWVVENPVATKATVERGFTVYGRHLWPAQRDHFVQVVTRLVSPAMPLPV